MSAGMPMTRRLMLSGGSSSLSIRSKGEDWLNSLRVALGPLCEFTSLFDAAADGRHSRRNYGTKTDDRLGFAHLNPQFGIRFGGNDKTRLPSACKPLPTFVSIKLTYIASCANLLKLYGIPLNSLNVKLMNRPDYQDEALLREKLLQSIDSGAGFDLS